MTHCAALLALAVGAPPDLPSVTLHTLEAWVRGDSGPRIAKQVRFEAPSAWTGDRERDRRSVTLYGPDGEGTARIALLLQPSELKARLDALARRHPGSEPSPPEVIELPQIRAALGDRATRYPITGRQVGEIVLIERREALVLVAIVVRDEAWPAVSTWARRLYESVEVTRGSP